MFKGAIVALGFVCAPILALAEADRRLEIFELQYREAGNLLPLIEPLLAKGAIVEAEGQWLLVKASPENLHEVEQVLEKTDRPPRRLLVTLAWRDGHPQHDSHQVYQTHREESSQQLQLLEGEWAQIRLGEAIPVGRRNNATTDGITVSDGMDYLSLMRTVEVRARRVGDRVKLDIRPSRTRESHQDGGRIAIESLATTVAGPLGEWLELGGQGAALPDQAVKRYSTAPDPSRVRIFVRVEEVEP